MLKNTEPTTGTNCSKNGMKNQKNEKRCKNCTENTASGGINTLEYNPINKYKE